YNCFHRLSMTPHDELLLLGWKGVGKSSVGNSILGRRYFESGQETELCLRRQALVSGRRITIVDTPGWDWFSVRRTPKRIRQESQVLGKTNGLEQGSLATSSSLLERPN
uniref:AIG1-type G domain-containing protein n=1 Tax=Sander lucioperca TaxID=283035 RepID=A0A8C9XWK7_SANLU